MCEFTALHKSSILFSRNINLTSRRLEFRTALTFFAYSLLIKISLGVHLLFGIDNVIKILLKVLNMYKKGHFTCLWTVRGIRNSIGCDTCYAGYSGCLYWMLKNKLVLPAKSSLLCLSCSSVSLSVLELWLSLSEIQICLVLHFRFN